MLIPLDMISPLHAWAWILIISTLEPPMVPPHWNTQSSSQSETSKIHRNWLSAAPRTRAKEEIKWSISKTYDMVSGLWGYFRKTGGCASKLPSYELQELKFNSHKNYTEKVVAKQESSVICLSVATTGRWSTQNFKRRTKKKKWKETASHVRHRPGTWWSQTEKYPLYGRRNFHPALPKSW